MTDRPVAHALAAHLAVFGRVRIQQMFGGWTAYVDEAPAAIIDRGALFLKLRGLTDAEIEALCGNAEAPYPGAKGYARIALVRFTDPEWVETVRQIRAATPPKPKAARKSRAPG